MIIIREALSPVELDDELENLISVSSSTDRRRTRDRLDCAGVISVRYPLALCARLIDTSLRVSVCVSKRFSFREETALLVAA
jgi:hypothetical protein